MSFQRSVRDTSVLRAIASSLSGRRRLTVELLEPRYLLNGDPSTPQPNIDYNLLEQAVFGLEPASQQQEVMVQLGAIEPEVTSISPDESIAVGGSGSHIIVPVEDIPEGSFVGEEGTGPCIGVIVYDGENVYVFHFDTSPQTSDQCARSCSLSPVLRGEG